MKYNDKEVEKLRSHVAEMLCIPSSEVTLSQHEDGSFTVKAHGQEFTKTTERLIPSMTTAPANHLDSRFAYKTYEKVLACLLFVAGVGLATYTRDLEPLILCVLYPAIRAAAVANTKSGRSGT